MADHVKVSNKTNKSSERSVDKEPGVSGRRKLLLFWNWKFCGLLWAGKWI